MDRFFFRDTFKSPEELDQFAVLVIQKLHQAGLDDVAKILENWRLMPCTTGNEWLGELGVAIRKIQKQYKVGKEINADLERMKREVRKVWLWV